MSPNHYVQHRPIPSRYERQNALYISRQCEDHTLILLLVCEKVRGGKKENISSPLAHRFLRLCKDVLDSKHKEANTNRCPKFLPRDRLKPQRGIRPFAKVPLLNPTPKTRASSLI